MNQDTRDIVKNLIAVFKEQGLEINLWEKHGKIRLYYYGQGIINQTVYSDYDISKNEWKLKVYLEDWFAGTRKQAAIDVSRCKKIAAKAHDIVEVIAYKLQEKSMEAMTTRKKNATLKKLNALETLIEIKKVA